ncbi:MAG: sigma factor [Candidatus Peribacteraceae bacterium]|nr:sigma factor [Candidatus Peribacteraceae bacterium]
MFSTEIDLHAWETVSDEELMLRYRNDLQTTDPHLFVLIHRYERPLYRHIMTQVGDRAVAEEIFQQVWLEVSRQPDAVDLQHGTVRGYVELCATRMALQHLLSTDYPRFSPNW